jgi:hypothetical protein
MPQNRIATTPPKNYPHQSGKNGTGYNDSHSPRLVFEGIGIFFCAYYFFGKFWTEIRIQCFAQIVQRFSRHREKMDYHDLTSESLGMILWL